MRCRDDEAHYLAVSILQWRGNLTSNCESPAPKWGFALALRLVDGELFHRGAPAR